jgi:hypothetical protein
LTDLSQGQLDVDTDAVTSGKNDVSLGCAFEASGLYLYGVNARFQSRTAVLAPVAAYEIVFEPGCVFNDRNLGIGY